MHFSCSVRQVQFTIQDWKKDWSNTSHLEIFFLFSFFFSVHVLPFSKIFKQLQLLLPLLGRCCPEFRYSCNNVHPRFWYYWLLAYEKLDMVFFPFFLYISFWFDGNIFYLVMAWIYFLDISNKTSTSWIKMPSCRSHSKWILKWDLLFI